MENKKPRLSQRRDLRDPDDHERNPSPSTESEESESILLYEDVEKSEGIVDVDSWEWDQYISDGKRR